MWFNSASHWFPLKTKVSHNQQCFSTRSVNIREMFGQQQYAQGERRENIDLSEVQGKFQWTVNSLLGKNGRIWQRENIFSETVFCCFGSQTYSCLKCEPFFCVETTAFRPVRI